jgi:hypothetical protein
MYYRQNLIEFYVIEYKICILQFIEPRFFCRRAKNLVPVFTELSGILSI